jgi:hypothetical protein
LITQASAGWREQPLADSLTRAVIAALEATTPATGTVSAEFLATLKATDPVAEVRSRVEKYKNRTAQRLTTISITKGR